MSVLNSVEGFYLHLLRVLALAFATIALIGVAVFGVRALTNYNATPKEVSKAISISPDAFRFGDELVSKAPDGGSDNATLGSTHSKLEDDFIAVLNKHGKALVGPTFEVNRTAVHNFVSPQINSADLGPQFVGTQTVYVDQVLGRADVAKEVRDGQTYFAMLTKILDEYRPAFLAEKERIASEEAAAQHDAMQKQAESTRSLYLVGALFSAFVLIVLLIVQIRIERHIRTISLGKAGA